MENLIELKNITKIYKTGEQDTLALKGIDLNIKKGEFVTIMGSSGSGKSTLLHILGLLDNPSAGSYFLNGKDVSRLSPNEQANIRNQEVGFVFQQFNLLPRTTVFDNILLPTIYGNKKDNLNKTAELIKQVGLEGQIFNKSNQLSGGQIQRVAIARALVMEPSIILADEPTGNLDTKTGMAIMEILKKINEQGKTIIVVTHEDHIAKFAHRIIKLKDGQIISSETNHSNYFEEQRLLGPIEKPVLGGFEELNKSSQSEDKNDLTSPKKPLILRLLKASIVIIFILIGLVLGSWKGWISLGGIEKLWGGGQATCKDDLNTIKSALTDYYTDEIKYPESTTIIKTSDLESSLYQALVPKYLEGLPDDPSEYYYGYQSDGKNFELTCVLEDQSDPDGTIINGNNIYKITNISSE